MKAPLKTALLLKNNNQKAVLHYNMYTETFKT